MAKLQPWTGLSRKRRTMLTLFPYFEKVIRVDGWVPKGLWRIEEIPFISIIAQSFQTRGRTLPLLSNLLSSGQCGLSKKGRWVSKTVHFISQAFQGVEERYPQMEKLAIYACNYATKAQVIFPSTYDHSPNRSTPEKSHEQPWGCWTNDFMGDRTQWIWYTVPPANCNKRASHGWVHHQIRSFRR